MRRIKTHQAGQNNFLKDGENIARGQSIMDRYKIQMKAYRKKMRKPKNGTPYLPMGGVVYIMDSLNPDGKMEAKVIKTTMKSQREVIEIIACPECKSKMMWDENWGAFTCMSHGKKAIYEIVNNERKGRY